MLGSTSLMIKALFYVHLAKRQFKGFSYFLILSLIWKQDFEKGKAPQNFFSPKRWGHTEAVKQEDKEMTGVYTLTCTHSFHQDEPLPVRSHEGGGVTNLHRALGVIIGAYTPSPPTPPTYCMYKDQPQGIEMSVTRSWNTPTSTSSPKRIPSFNP